MSPRNPRLTRLNPLLLSLLLHLAIVCFAGSGLLKREVSREAPSTGIVVAYLDPGDFEVTGKPGATQGGQAPTGSSVAGQEQVPTGLAVTGQERAPTGSAVAGQERVPARTTPAPGPVPNAGQFLSQQAPLSAASLSTRLPAAESSGVKIGSFDPSPAGSGVPGAVKTAGNGSAESKGGAPAAAGARNDGTKAGLAAATSTAHSGGGVLVGALAGGNSAATHTPAPSPSRPGAYQAQLKSLIEAHKQYPLACRKSGREGSCQRRFLLGRDGILRRVETLSSCGHPFLDAAATQAITAVGKFPPLPEEFKGIEESFSVTITFTLARK